MTTVTYTCEMCGAASTLKDGYVIRKAMFFRRASARCPACAGAKRFFSVERVIGISLGLVIALGGRHVGFLVPVFNLTFLPFWATLVASVVAHEAGHAAVLTLAGFRVQAVRIGSGRRLATLRFKDFRLYFHLLPFGGRTEYGCAAGPYSARREIAGVLAGPVANAIIVAAAAVAGATGPWAVSLRFVNSLMAVGNLIPFTRTSSFGPTETDGLVIIRILRRPDERPPRLRDSYFAARFLLMREERRFAEALAVAERWREAAPTSAVMRSSLGLALSEVGRFAEARAATLPILERSDVPETVRASAYNSVAWFDVMIGNRELLPESDRYSEMAWTMQGWVPSFLGTRGTVLVELDRSAEAVPLLQKAFRGTLNPGSKALNACYLAFALKNTGHADQAREMARRARKLDPKCPLLPKVAGLERSGSGV